MMLRFLLVLLGLGLAVVTRASEESHASAPKEPELAPKAAPVPEELKSEGKSEAKAEHGATNPETKSEEGAAAEHAAEPEISPGERDEIATLMKFAQSSYDGGRNDAALIAYRQLLTKHLSRAQERIVILGFARALRKKGDLTKAAAIYEKILKEYPLEEDTPEVYLELGRTQRALGAYKSAIGRFYSVINSTIKLPEDGAMRYRQLAKTAQFEIAETYFQAGNYAEASRFYSRLRLLDLAEADRARAHFKSAYSLTLADDNLGAITSLRSYLEQHPDDENVPEAHYLLADCYRKLKRPMEAMVEALELLRMEKTKTAKDPKRWAYWQRKTGNQIANELFEQGNSADALTIYQTLSELSAEDNWRLPVLYQIALCQERLGLMDKAMTCYKTILDKVANMKATKEQQAEFADLSHMAEWRLSQINWQHNTEKSLQQLLPEKPAPQPPAPPSKK